MTSSLILKRFTTPAKIKICFHDRRRNPLGRFLTFHETKVLQTKLHSKQWAAMSKPSEDIFLTGKGNTRLHYSYYTVYTINSQYYITYFYIDFFIE